jgi:hypothetical protein
MDTTDTPPGTTSETFPDSAGPTAGPTADPTGSGADLSLLVSRPRRRHRSGQPWTDGDYEQMLALVREGQDADHVADAIGRSPQAVAGKMRAVLPVEQRSCPADRVLPALRAQLAGDPAYPWAEIVLQSPPPPPIVRQVVHREGVGGLDDDDLVTIAWALIACEGADEEVVQGVCQEVRERSLTHRVTDRFARSLMRRTPPVMSDEAHEASVRWFDEAAGLAEVSGLSSPYARRDRYPYW